MSSSAYGAAAAGTRRAQEQGRAVNNTSTQTNDGCNNAAFGEWAPVPVCLAVLPVLCPGGFLGNYRTNSNNTMSNDGLINAAFGE